MRRPAVALRAMRGAMAVVGALWLGVAVICLMAIDIGHVFWQQREVQKIADMAAMAGAGQESCVARIRAIAQSNGFSAERDIFFDPEDDAPVPAPLADLDLMCGNWDPQARSGSGSPPQHYAAKALPSNAARVAISRKVPYFFVLSWGTERRVVNAKATAATHNVAGFSLGTGVAGLSGGVVNQLLNALLGTGNRIALDAVSYQGLANAHVRLIDLVDLSPTAGTVQELLDTRLGIGQLAALMAGALGPGNALAVNALNDLVNVGLDSLTVTLGDLLNVTSTNPEAAATAQINVLEMLMVAAQVANGSNLVNLQGGLNLPPLATVATKLVIVEPPSIAIGQAGRLASGEWKTQAHSAAIRLKLDASVVDTSKIPLVGALAGIQALRLPLYMEVAPGDAWLSDLQCAATREDSRVTIGARPGLANLCIGEVTDSQMSNTSAPLACGAAATVSRVSLLFIPLVEVKARAAVQASVPLSAAQDLVFDGVIGNGDDIQRGTSNAAGSVLANAVDSLVDELQLEACILGICGNASYLTDVLSVLNTHVVTPLLTLLNAVIEPLLGLLGVQIGYSDVHHQSLSCGEPQLVY